MSLESFGFTPTETRVYGSLLRLGPSTGYAVAKAVGLARANVYQALEGLARRGAARRSATIPVKYAATHPSRLVVELERRFARQVRELEKALSVLAEGAPETAPVAGADITDAATLVASGVACAQSAEQELLVVAGPAAAMLAGDLEAVRGGVANVRILWLGDAGAPASAVRRPVQAAAVRAYWGGEPLAMVADRSRAVCGIFLPQGGAAGLATDSPGVVPFIRHLLRRELAAGGTAPL